MIQVYLRRVLLGAVLAHLTLQSKVVLAESLRVADGATLTLDDQLVSIVPPKGWEYQERFLGKTLVIQSPQGPTVYGKLTYQRNITLALMREPKPIDELQAQELTAKLNSEFGRMAGVSNYFVIEHRFIDHRSKGDAILLYSSFELNGTPMSQMHIFVSGSDRSALLSYTDLAADFQKNDEWMTQAWNAMLSIKLPGLAPERYHDIIPAAAGLGLGLLAMLCLLAVRRRAAQKMLIEAEDHIYQETEHAWDADLSAVSAVYDHRPKRKAQVRSDVWELETQVAAHAKPRKARQVSKVSEWTDF